MLLYYPPLSIMKRTYTLVYEELSNSFVMMLWLFSFYTWNYTLGFIKFESEFCSWGAGHFAAPFFESFRFQTRHFRHTSRDYWELCCCYDRSSPLIFKSSAAHCKCRYIILNHVDLINLIVWYNNNRYFDGFRCSIPWFCFPVPTLTFSSNIQS